MTSTTRPSSPTTAGQARHRAAPAASAFAALRDRAGLGGGGRPVVGHRRAAVAGVALATAAVGTGLLAPTLVGDEAGGAARAEDRGTVPGRLPATTLELVSGRSLGLEPARARRAASRAAGADARVDGRTAAPAAGSPEGTATSAAAPGVHDLSDDHGGTGGVQIGQDHQSGADDGHGGAGGSDGTDGGDSDDALLGGAVDAVVQTTAPARTQLPRPVGDLADGTGAVVEETVAGPLGGIVP